jgi:ankyrin repeat protein
VVFLLQHGADLYAKTSNDMNAVHAACEAGKVEVVRAIYDFCDADGKAKLSAETCGGKTAWDIASGAKQQALCTALKEAGDTNAASAACVIS